MTGAEGDDTAGSLASEGRGLEERWAIFIRGPRFTISGDDGLFRDRAMTSVGQ